MKSILFIIVFVFTITLSAQKDNFFCDNFWKETLNSFSNPDTFFVAADFTSNYYVSPRYYKSKDKAGRLVVFIYKKNDIWYSSYCVVTVEKNQHFVWYQSASKELRSLRISKNYIDNSFETSFNDLIRFIEYSENNPISILNSSHVYLYIKKGDSVVEFPTKDYYNIFSMLNFIETEYDSLYHFFSIGLLNSITLDMEKKYCSNKIKKRYKHFFFHF